MIKNQLKSINPKNNIELSSWDIPSSNDLKHIIKKTARAQLNWSEIKLTSRLAQLKNLTQLLKESCNEMSILMADEMGKPKKQGIGEISKCAWLCDYYYKNSEQILSDKHIETEFHKSFITYRPIGLILGVMPWNFPFWQVVRYAIPSLIVGNGVLLKHASNVQGCANIIKDLFVEAGFPKNIFNNLQIPSSLVSKVIEHDQIQGVAVTGSIIAGKAIAKISGENLKKTVLELGGNDPYLILEDAELNYAVQAVIDGRLLNSGQSCISAKRIIVTKNNIELFTKKLIDKLRLKVMGDPHDDVDYGPLVSFSARAEVHKMVESSIKMGANLCVGGKIPNFEGAYYPITVLSKVQPGMPAFEEEIFGPVFSIIEAHDNDHAIHLANNSKFGLGAAVFTSDISGGKKIAKEKIQAGICFVNDYIKSDPRLPFGGVKMSGYGRELSSYGLMEFVNIKSIVVENNN
tara:strand:+ start:11614 stop:12996 length:1383 start_codon:yes stop_codon:yes gene_type:complete